MDTMTSTKDLMAGPETIGTHIEVLGANRAISKLPYGYNGACRVEDGNGFVLGVLPNKEEAYSVARYAIFPDGGYASPVTVYKAKPEDKITHMTLEDWICD